MSKRMLSVLAAICLALTLTTAWAAAEEVSEEVRMDQEAVSGELEEDGGSILDEGTIDFTDLLPSGDELLLRDLGVGDGIMPIGEIGSTPAYNTLNREQRALYSGIRAWIGNVNRRETDQLMEYSHTFRSRSEYENVLEPTSDERSPLISVCSCICNDVPGDFYWWGRGISYMAIPNQDGSYTLKIRFRVADEYRLGSDEFTLSGAQMQRAHRSVENARKLWTTANNSGWNDYQKMDYYRQQICDLTSYNYDAAAGNWGNSNDPWAMVWVFDGDPSTNVVCEGYSKAFQLLCDNTLWNDSSIHCFTVTGDMNGGGHMWNVVQIQGRNYLVDITNCDSGMVGYPNSLFLVGGQGSARGGYIVSTPYKNISYVYDHDYWDDSILTLSSSDYVYTPSLGGRVSITGTATVGSTLTADISRLVAEGASVSAGLSYVWKVGGVDAGTSDRYVVKASDVGKQITVTVTSSQYAGSVTSASVTAQAAAQTAPSQPELDLNTSGSTSYIVVKRSVSGVEYAVADVTDGSAPDTSKLNWLYQGTGGDLILNRTTVQPGGKYRVFARKAGGNGLLPSDPVSRDITIPEKDDGKLHGKITVSANYAPEGEELIMHIVPDTGYRLGSVKVSGKDGQQVQVTGNGERYTFRMPAFDVFVEVDFIKI